MRAVLARNLGGGVVGTDTIVGIIPQFWASDNHARWMLFNNNSNIGSIISELDELARFGSGKHGLSISLSLYYVIDILNILEGFGFSLIFIIYML